MSSTRCNHQHCPHTFPAYVVNDQLQLCIHPCSDDVKRQSQQCWIIIRFKLCTHQQTVSFAGARVPKPSFNDLWHSRAILPNKTWNFITVKSVYKKLPCSLSWSIAKQQMTSQRQCTFVTAPIQPLAPHKRFEFNQYEALYQKELKYKHSIQMWSQYYYMLVKLGKLPTR
jgi:hypothetical protein